MKTRQWSILHCWTTCTSFEAIQGKMFLSCSLSISWKSKTKQGFLVCLYIITSKGILAYLVDKAKYLATFGWIVKSKHIWEQNHEALMALIQKRQNKYGSYSRLIGLRWRGRRMKQGENWFPKPESESCYFLPQHHQCYVSCSCLRNQDQGLGKARETKEINSWEFMILSRPFQLWQQLPYNSLFSAS